MIGPNSPAPKNISNRQTGKCEKTHAQSYLLQHRKLRTFLNSIMLEITVVVVNNKYC